MRSFFTAVSSHKICIMNTWFVLAALTWFGSSLAQPSCAPGPFVADSFDIFNFTILRSYHDVSTLLTLYETPAGENVYLFDFNEGRLYVNRPNNTCLQYENPDSEVTLNVYCPVYFLFDLWLPILL